MNKPYSYTCNVEAGYNQYNITRDGVVIFTMVGNPFMDADNLVRELNKAYNLGYEYGCDSNHYPPE